MICERRNYKRYEDYGGKNWPYAPSRDYSASWIQKQMYARPPEPTEMSATPEDPGMEENRVSRNPPGLAHGPNVLRGTTGIIIGEMLGIIMGSRRKSEASAHVGNESAPLTIKEER